LCQKVFAAPSKFILIRFYFFLIFITFSYISFDFALVVSTLHLEPCGQNNLLLINFAGQAKRLGRGSGSGRQVIIKGVKDINALVLRMYHEGWKVCLGQK